MTDLIPLYKDIVDDLILDAYTKEIFGHEVKVINTSGLFQEELGSRLCKGWPFCVIWNYDGFSKKFYFSLYSDENGLNVEELVKKLNIENFGGNKNIIGFSLKPEQVDSILDLE